MRIEIKTKLEKNFPFVHTKNFPLTVREEKRIYRSLFSTLFSTCLGFHSPADFKRNKEKGENEKVIEKGK